MTGPTVFPTLSLDRSQVWWEDYLDVLTPVTAGERHLYKREDAFAPLGYGGINGSKLRQLVWLVDTYCQHGGAVGIVTGASVRSPQVSMAALVGAHYGLPVTVVLGATKPTTARRHEQVAIAAAAGARFAYAKVAYNPALQRSVAALAASRDYQAHFRLPYGISAPADASAGGLRAFHAVGARQVANLPDSIRTLVLPFGSGNSAAAVLYGLAAVHRPARLRRVVLVGIGPSRQLWLQGRLGVLGARLGDLQLEHHDLHAQGFCAYDQRMAGQLDGIDLHPTYEGKLARYFATHRDRCPWWWDAAPGETCLWIVGGEGTRAAMAQAWPQALGEVVPA